MIAAYLLVLFPSLGLTNAVFLLFKKPNKIHWGVVYYVVLLLLAVLVLAYGKIWALGAMFFISFIGFMHSLCLTGAQIFAIGRFCLPCLFSAFVNTCLFVLMLILSY